MQTQNQGRADSKNATVRRRLEKKGVQFSALDKNCLTMVNEPGFVIQYKLKDGWVRVPGTSLSTRAKDLVEAVKTTAIGYSGNMHYRIIRPGSDRAVYVYTPAQVAGWRKES